MTDIRCVLEIQGTSGKVFTCKNIIFTSLKAMGGRKGKEKLFSDTNQKFFRQTEGQKDLFVPGISVLIIYIKTLPIQNCIGTRLFIEKLFAITRYWKQPKCQYIEGC